MSRRSACRPGRGRCFHETDMKELCDMFESSVTTLLVKCPSVQWQPDGLTIQANKWFLGARFQGAPPISLSLGRPQLEFEVK